MTDVIKIPKQVLVDATFMVNEFCMQIETIKNRYIAAKMMIMLITDQFSSGVMPPQFPDAFPNWTTFNWKYSPEEKAIIRNAGLALAFSLYQEFEALGLVHLGRIPYVTNRVEGQGLIVLDFMPY